MQMYNQLINILESANAYAISMNDDNAVLIVNEHIVEKLKEVFDEHEVVYKVTGGDEDPFEIDVTSHLDAIREVHGTLKANQNPKDIITVFPADEHGNVSYSIAFIDEEINIHLSGDEVIFDSMESDDADVIMNQFEWEEHEGPLGEYYSLGGGLTTFKKVAKFITENANLERLEDFWSTRISWESL